MPLFKFVVSDTRIWRRHIEADDLETAQAVIEEENWTEPPWELLDGGSVETIQATEVTDDVHNGS